MTYNFDKPTKRRGTNCVKWDEMPNEETLPLWVADMDFETAPAITEALRKRMEHGCFGYTFVPESYYTACINWFGRKHGWEIKREWFIYTSGVVPAISAIIKAMTQPGDKVLVQTPVYNCFFSSIRNNGCVLAENKLKYATSESSNNDVTYQTAHNYIIDFDDFEQKCADPQTKVFLLCNPHNPAGRVWTRYELQRMAEICLRNGVFVIADEIHCEFVNSKSEREIAIQTCYGEKHPTYTPFASLGKEYSLNCATCVSPSKAFNIAGLQIANIIIKDDAVRAKVDKAININEVCDVNPFGVIALQAAYNEGEEWLSQLNDYIYSNYTFVSRFIDTELPQLEYVSLEATYLMWVNVERTGMSGTKLAEKLLNDVSVYVNPGEMYGDDKFIRINLATQKCNLEEAMKRIKQCLA